MKLTIGWDFSFKLQTVLNNNLLLGAILKAAIAGMVSKQKRATVYGILGTGYGLSWFLDSALMGILYHRLITALIVFLSTTQLLTDSISPIN